MVDLDSDPTKLIEIVEIGKQLLMTRGALTTFSIANDVAKYFAIIPAIFLTTYPALGAAERDGAPLAALGDPRERDLQRARDRRAHPARVARRSLPADRGGVDPAAQSAPLRARRPAGPVHRDRGDRPRARSSATRLRPSLMTFPRQLRAAAVLTVLLSALTGILYPGAVTALAHLLFPRQANGSLVEVGGASSAASSSGSHSRSPGTSMADRRRPAWAMTAPPPRHQQGADRRQARRRDLRTRGLGRRAGGCGARRRPGGHGDVVGSGLDPHISPANARLQVARVAARAVPTPPPSPPCSSGTSRVASSACSASPCERAAPQHRARQSLRTEVPVIRHSRSLRLASAFTPRPPRH